MADLIDLRERFEDFDEILETMKDAVRSQIRTAVPVSVTQDSTDGHTVSLQPMVKALVRGMDGKVALAQLPVLDKTPIHHAAGGGVTTTRSHKKGDEGVILVSDSAIDVWHQQGGVQSPGDTRAHALSDAVYVPGVRNDTNKLTDYNTEATEHRSDDGKNRTIHHPKNGTKVSNNGGKQVLDVNATSGAIQGFSKTLTFAAGDVPSGAPQNATDTVNRELNDQLKGLRAEMTQVKDSHHALFDVVSKLRMNVESVVPLLRPVNAATQVTTALSGTPGGLDAMKALAAGSLQGYFQTALTAALQDFLNPSRLLSAGSVLGGGIEGLIKALTAQIAQLIAANPVIAQSQDLQRQIDGILARGAAPDVQAAALVPIQDQIDALAKDNPIIGQVQDLASKLQGLASQAGPGMNFLAPQQRLAQGLLKSVHFSE